MTFKRFTIIMLTLCSLAYAGDYYVPEIQCGNGNMTYIGAVNPTDAAAELTVLGFGGDGTEYGASEALTSLNAMGMAYMSINDLFGENAANICWLKVSSMANLHVFAEVMNTGTRSAYWSSSKLSENLYTPHVAKNTEAFTTVIVSVNGTNQGFQTALRPKPSGPTKVLTEHTTPYGKAKKNVLDLWSDVSTINWVWMESNAAGNSAMEYFSYNTKNAMASLGLEDSKGKTLRFLHVATDTVNFWTGMVYINVGDAAASVTETYYDANGFVLKTYQPDPIDPSGKVTLLFDANTQERVPAGTAWVQVTSDQDLVGYELFGSANGKDDATFAGIQGNYTHGNVLDYPYYTATEGTWAGIVAVNVGTETADLTFKLMNADGQVVDTYVKSGVAPNKKVVSVGSSMFPNATDGMWVQAKASASQFAGFMLWGDKGGTIRDHLSGVNAKVSTESTGGPGEPVERVYIPSVTGNTTYETAMELTPTNGAWNINVVGTILVDTEGEVSWQDGADDFEAVYKFTLDKPTALVVAIAPEVASADMDLFVVDKTTYTDEDLSNTIGADNFPQYSANGFGYENLARVFPAGTYYVLISLYEDGGLPGTDFGLLVTEYPLYLNTFETAEDVARFAETGYVYSNNDSEDADGTVGWAWTELGDYKNGGALVNATENSELEWSSLATPFINIPETGTTVFNFDMGNILKVDITDDVYPVWWLQLRVEGQEEYETIWAAGVGPNAGNYTANVTLQGQTYPLFLVNYDSWMESAFDFQAEPGYPTSFNIIGRNSDHPGVIDNFQLHQVATSLDAKKRAKTPGKIIFTGFSPKKKFKALSKMP